MALEPILSASDVAMRSNTHGVYNNKAFLPPPPAVAGSDPTSNASSDKNLDIVSTFKWTYSNFREEVPRIQLIEKQITNNQSINFSVQRIKNIANAATQNFANLNTSSSIDPYAGLYDAVKTGFTYIFPYLPANTIDMRSSWTSSMPKNTNFYESTIGSAIATVFGIDNPVGKANTAIDSAQALLNWNDPYVGIEQPNYFQGPEKQSYTISFPLYNTVNVSETVRNYNFIRRFAYYNLFDRKTASTYTPPVIYEVSPVQGYDGALGHLPAVYVSSFVVKNIGSVRAIKMNNSLTRVMVPEAYMITITIKELIGKSRQIFSSFITGIGTVSTDTNALTIQQ